MKMAKTLQGTTLEVALEGRLDAKSSSEVEEELNGCLDGVDSMRIDCSKLEYTSSAGLRVLLNLHMALSDKGGLTLTHVNEMVQAVFDVTGFSSILTVV